MLTNMTNKRYTVLISSPGIRAEYSNPQDIKRLIGLLQGLSKHILQHAWLVFVFVCHIPCKISSVPCVILHISTQNVVSLSAKEPFQGVEEFTQSLYLSVGGRGNCKDKSLQQLKPSFLFTRAFGISQISQIQPCHGSYQKPDHAHFQREMQICSVCVGGNLPGLIFVKVSVA